MTTDNRQWFWYYARFKEGLYSGPFGSRADAIIEGKGDFGGEGFWVAEATNPPVKLSAWIGADWLLERAEENIFDNDRASSEYDDVVFDATPEQQTDLIARIKAVCDQWQIDHDLEFRCSTFEAMRNAEWIPDEEEEA